MIPCAFHLRYSSDRKNDRSAEDQEAVCRAYAERQGSVVAAVYVDRAKSGANVGAGCERSNIAVVRTICALMDELVPDSIGPRERLITFVADRPGHDLRYAMDARKFRAELGWAPQETFATGLRKTVEWYLTNRAW